MAAAAPVEIRGLCHDVGEGEHRRRILRDVETRVPAGEIVIVTGPSGSGKTTLLTLVGALRSAVDELSALTYKMTETLYAKLGGEGSE